jgi:hypothetical protein
MEFLAGKTALDMKVLTSTIKKRASANLFGNPRDFGN